MVGAHQEQARFRITPTAPQGFPILVGIGATFIVGYAGATLAGAPSPLLSDVFNVPMGLVLLAAWWAFLRAPPEIRQLWRLLSFSATCWAIGTIGWTIQFESNGEHVLQPPTIWDVPFVCSLTLALIAIVVAIRGAVHLRHAVLDAVVVTVAGLAVGTAFIEQALGRQPSLRALATLNRPIFGVITLVLIASAAAGSSEGIRRSTALLGLGQVFFVAGHLVYAAESLGGGPFHDRWPDVAWATGGVVSLLAAASVIRRNDPLVRFGPAISDSAHPRGSGIGIAVAFAGLLTSIAVALWGTVADQHVSAIVGVVAALVCATGLALRARSAFRAADAAYLRLDSALLDLERASDDLGLANRDLVGSNRQLADANMRLRLYQTALREILGLVDRRSRGELRSLVAETTGVSLDEVDPLDDG